MCVFEGHRRLLPQVTKVAQSVQVGLTSRGVDPSVVPGLFVELAGNERSETPEAWTFAAPLRALGRQELSAFALLQDLTVPKHCDALFAPTPPSEAYFDAQIELTVLVARAAGIQVPSGVDLAVPAPAGTQVGQAERISALLHDLRRCRLEAPGSRP